MHASRLVTLALVLALAACAGRNERSGAAGATAGQGDGNRISASGVPGRGGSSGIEGGTVYFEFDSAQLRAEDASLLDTWGKYLVANAGARLTLQGHTDERGTPDYNVGLGERRAVAVREALVARGARAEQLSVTSLGEGHPADAGHSEKAWSKNRRVELLD